MRNLFCLHSDNMPVLFGQKAEMLVHAEPLRLACLEALNEEISTRVPKAIAAKKVREEDGYRFVQALEEILASHNTAMWWIKNETKLPPQASCDPFFSLAWSLTREKKRQELLPLIIKKRTLSELVPARLIIFDYLSLVTTESGQKFPEDPRDWTLLPGRVERLNELSGMGVTLAIATNQGGVAFGKMDQGELDVEIRNIARELQIDLVEICYTHPTGIIDAYKCEDPRRKPAPGMFYNILAQTGIESGETLVVGDRYEDKEAAEAGQMLFSWTWEFFSDLPPVHLPEPEPKMEDQDEHDPLFLYGKYKGRSVNEVWHEDRNYIEWVARQAVYSDTLVWEKARDLLKPTSSEPSQDLEVASEEYLF